MDQRKDQDEAKSVVKFRREAAGWSAVRGRPKTDRRQWPLSLLDVQRLNSPDWRGLPRQVRCNEKLNDDVTRAEHNARHRVAAARLGCDGWTRPKTEKTWLFRPPRIGLLCTGSLQCRFEPSARSGLETHKPFARREVAGDIFSKP